MRKKYSFTKQHDQSDCAAAVISIVLKNYKSELTMMKIREIIGTDAFGTSIKGVVEGLEKLKFNVKAIRVEIDDITPDITLPAIAHVRNKEGQGHFVVIHKITKKDQLIIADPAKQVSKVSFEDFRKIYQGVLILCAPTSEFERTSLKGKGMFELFKLLILPQKGLLMITIFTSLLLSIIGIFTSMFSKVLMDEIIPFQLKKSLYVFLIVFGIVTLVQNLLSAFRQHVLLYLSRKIDIPLLLGYYNHIIRLPYFFFGTRKVGDILTRFQDAMTIKSIFTSVSISLVMDILLSLISAIVLFNINATLFGILLLIVLVNIVLIYIFKKPYKKINQDQMESSAMLNSQLIESMKNIETVKAMGDEQHQIDQLETRYVNALEIGYKEGVLQNVQGVVSNFIGSLGNLLFMGVGALFIIDQKMTIGDLLVFQTLSQYFTEPVSNLVSLQITFQEAQIAMTRLSELMSIEQEDENGAALISGIDLSGDIEFDHVSFSYGTRPPVLKSLSLNIPKGKKVAFVGESGAGKSTLAKLLMKFIEVDDGKLALSGYNIKDINTAYLRSKIAYIPQNIELFTGTIIDNLKVGNPNASYEAMMIACRRSCASAFIEKLPNRYGSFIEEGGTNLSGGEKQRIAIARALLSEPDLFIFDEATSNLDSFSEKKIQDLIFNRIVAKTVIIIAHRLSTIRACDHIVFLEHGRIVEQGTHDELMKLNGRYAQMVIMQTGESITLSHRETKNSNGEEISYE